MESDNNPAIGVILAKVLEIEATTTVLLHMQASILASYPSAGSYESILKKAYDDIEKERIELWKGVDQAKRDMDNMDDLLDDLDI